MNAMQRFPQKETKGMILVKRTLVLAVLVACAFAVQDARSAPVSYMDAKPRCAIQDIPPPRIIMRGTGGKSQQRFIWGEFVNTCLDPTIEMGAFACIEEINDPGGPAKPIDCHANIERTPFTMVAPHDAAIFMVAKCNYTSIPRYYKVTGYAWAVSLPTDSIPPQLKYWRGPRPPKKKAESKIESFRVSLAGSGQGDVHFCDISAAGTTWREFR